MNNSWFRKWQWTYVPAHLMCLLITVLPVIFLMLMYMATVGTGYSVNDELIPINCMHYLYCFLVEMGSGTDELSSVFKSF